MENFIAKVKLWGTTIGTIQYDRSEPRHAHTIMEAYRNSDKLWPIAPTTVPSLSQRTGCSLLLISMDKETSLLPGFIYDSLPGQWGSSIMMKYAQVKGISSKHLSPIQRLSLIGRRGMGALEYTPESFRSEGPDTVDLDSLYGSVRKICEGGKKFKFDSLSGEEIDTVFKVCTAAGGMRPKAVIAISDKTGEVRSGLNHLPEKGQYTHYLIKFEEKGSFPRTRVEMAYHLMALDAGISMMPCSLLEKDGACHFLTKRFDRVKGEKIHTQTLYAMNNGAYRYEHLFGVARKLLLDEGQIQELYRRMVFNVMACNVDDHDRNFSFMMGKDGVWKITPAYDLTFSIDNRNTLTGDLHAMSIGGKKRNLTDGNLEAFADENNIPGAKKILGEVRDAVQNFRTYAEKTGVEERWIEEIEATMKTRRALGRRGK